MRIVLDSLTPAAPGKSSTLTVRGTLVNTSSTAIEKVRVGLRKSSAPLADRTDLATIAQLPAVPHDGSPDDVELPGSIVSLADTLAPGDRSAFTLTMPVESLGLPEPGTYVLGIEALGTMSAGSGSGSNGSGSSGSGSTESRLADLRTYLPWYPSGSLTPVSIAWLWPLADWPARTATGLLLDERTPAELSQGGRLSRLVELGDKRRGLVSWIADPELLQTAADMSDGYLVDRDGQAVPGEREGAAATWLSDVAAATDSGRALRTLPYADVDASAVTRAGLPTDVVRAVTQGPAVAEAALGTPITGGLYWAPFGRLDRPALSVLASAGIREVVLSSLALPATDPTMDLSGSPIASIPTSAGTIRAVLTDPGLSALVATTSGAGRTPVTVRQEFLATTALISQNADPTMPDPTVVVAPATVRWDPDDAIVAALLKQTGSAPWLHATTLAELSDAPVTAASRQRGGYGDKAREAELTAGYMASVKSLAEHVDSFTSVIDDPTGVSDDYDAAILRAESSAWRSQPQTGVRLVRTTGTELKDQTDRVRVLSAGTVTFSGDNGRVPVTISNELDRAVTVGLRLEGVPALRLESEPLTSIRIEPGKMASVDIDARVVGGDPLPVDVQLITPDGEAFAAPAHITLVSTAYARAAAWVVAVAFLAIVVFVIVGVYRRIHAASISRNEPPA